MLNGVAGKSKCVDSAAVKKVTETAGPDLILALEQQQTPSTSTTIAKQH